MKQTNAKTEDKMWGKDGAREGVVLDHIEQNWEKAPVQTLDLHSLQSHQATVTRTGVEKYLTNPNASHGEKTVVSGQNELDASHVVVLKHGTSLVVQDGNHRVAAAILRGDETIQAKVIDISPKAIRAAQAAKPKAPEKFGYLTKSGWKNFTSREEMHAHMKAEEGEK